MLYVPLTVALRHVAALLMLPVFVLLLAAYLPGRIKAATKHSDARGHQAMGRRRTCWPNGNLADAALFGGFRLGRGRPIR